MKEIRSTYWAVRGDSLDEMKSRLQSYSTEELTALAINERFNSFIGDWADYKNTTEDPRGHGKRVPYIGWFWRAVNFAQKEITIGDCGDFIGFMENNKWDYPQRDLSLEEADKVINIIIAAIRAANQGGLSDKIHADTEQEILKLWELMQTFTIPVRVSR